MEAFPHYWSFVWESGDFPHEGQRRVALIFISSVPEQTGEQTIEALLIWDAIALIMT